MCGISGVYTTQISDDHQRLIRAIIENQLPRGPDHQEMLTIQSSVSQTILGHNRLSIIDLSASANQPLWDSSGRYCIVYNGEIYNYLELRDELIQLGQIFRTHGDTEVILNAFAVWGIAALTRFDGPFAFALLDKDRDALWLCRDRFGVRPLYYIQKNNSLYFASSTAVLAKHLHLRPNLHYVAQGLKYLVYEDGSEMTAYQGLVSLPAGCYLSAHCTTSGKLHTTQTRYYDLDNQVQNLTQRLPVDRLNDLLPLIQDTFEKAVQIRLRTDVPLAISLSSGLDSSSVAALVSHRHPDTIGFSFSHPRHKKSEGPLVEKCANFLAIKMEYVWPTPSAMIDALYKTIAAQDAPFASLSIVAQYLLYERVRSSGIKVLLGGQGGDESFMGYKKFLFFQLQQLLRQKRYLATAKNLLQLLPMFCAELPSLGAYWQHRHRYLRSKERSSALQLPEAPLLHLHSNIESGLISRQLQDITQLSLPTLLRYEDRNAMGNSVESRLPFLDHRLVELGLALPVAIKLRAGFGKWPIRQIMRDKIPNAIRLARYKRGFDLPLAELLAAGLGTSLRAALHRKGAFVKEFLKRDQSINQLFSDQQFTQRQSAVAEAITLLWLSKDSL